jgi:hypothetical protein
MRMTKRNKELLRLYQRERARAFQPNGPCPMPAHASNGTNTKLPSTRAENPLTRNVAMSGSA